MLCDHLLLMQPSTQLFTQLLTGSDAVWLQANWLRSVGVKKGDAVCIYMPMLPELPIAMLACARIGAVHSVVFAGFSSESLAQRIEDCKSNVVITCNGAAMCICASCSASLNCAVQA